jgi:predicted nucleic acid-binding protein
MEETLLLPGDCIHLQTMLNQNCGVILSTDKDFDGIRKITRMKPE